ncbi:F0F1 ATP synthase subunit B [Flexivirga meconopsidis]|uniref:F0F1 ATP synthase subunit B n=1 Tax=Flexivirga meconopsidis TaxID=2977121 RepID=UPI0022403860|nr:F0F1 ATP synthase subunit B [Flexivirga meconopsidis]
MLSIVKASGGEVGWPEKLPLLPQPGEMIAGLIFFAIVYWLMKTKIVPRMEQMYAERTAAIEGGMEQAEQAQKEAEQAKSQYEAQLADARAEAARIREDARSQGAQIIAEMRDQAGAESDRIIDSAHKQTEAERQQAQVELRGHVGRLSTDLAGKIVGESLEDETRQRGIVERFLADLEAGDVKPQKVGSADEGA